MATLLLGAAGSALGSAVLPSGISFLGATITGSALGGAIGSIAGSLIDQKLFGPSARTSTGPRLADLHVQASTEGAPIPRVYGRARVAGQIIWATKFKERVETTSTGGGKGGGGGGVTSETYSYSVSFAVGLCEGPVTRLGRVWADGKPLDLSGIRHRFYAGNETQTPDPLIEAVEGAGAAPAYRGLAYVVFEDLQLAAFGSRVPQLSFEVFKALDGVENNVRAVTIIPGATEFGYDPQTQREVLNPGVTRTLNVNSSLGGSDWAEALDQLQATCPNCTSVALVVTWFGDDLRCGQCTVRPKVEAADKTTAPDEWQVAGLLRGDALPVSLSNGRPAFGGTPSDRSVLRAIADLKARGFRVLFYPFLMMDIPEGNTLTDPYSQAPAQPAYPWRGRITCDPAPGVPGSADKSPAAAAQIGQFFGSASAADFTLEQGSVVYSGPDEWTIRRMMLHYAHLAALAGGVDAFLIGTEMRGLTQIRSDASTYPAVAQLRALAQEVAPVLGAGCKLSYAADWSEYFGHQPADGSGDVFCHLDPLWADPAIDFVGIDTYMPLSDWRDGRGHLDRDAGWERLHDPAYLMANVEGGEGYDWYYANEEDRGAQIRTPITDGAHGKPWVFRYKDLRSWWSNPHHDRPAGIESPAPTAWVPQSKPIWLTELGCPAVDKGTNQPNVFIDEKSSESALPYFSNGRRDDLIQRAYIEAMTRYWDPNVPDGAAGTNPISSVYGQEMVDPENMYFWTWDARPYPAFPQRDDIWADGRNWLRGHWLTGRLGSASLQRLVAAILEEAGFAAFSVSDIDGVVDGFVIDGIMSARDALQPLMLAHFFSAAESQGILAFRHLNPSPQREIARDGLVVAGGAETADLELVRGQETELPSIVKLAYLDGDGDYRQAAVEARRLTKSSERTSSGEVPIVMTQNAAQEAAEAWLHKTWVERDRVRFALPPSLIALDPGDTVVLTSNSVAATYRLTAISDAGARQMDAVAADADVLDPIKTPERFPDIVVPVQYGPPETVFLDLPRLKAEDSDAAPYVASFSDPWPGAVALFRAADGDGFLLDSMLTATGTLGLSEAPFEAGPRGRWDNGNALVVRLFGGAPVSADTLSVLNGANAAALEISPGGGWEILQFSSAELIAEDTYALTGLLRGQLGTDAAMKPSVAAGARFVLLNDGLTQPSVGLAERGLELIWRSGPARHSIDRDTYQTQSFSFSGVGLRPFSVVHPDADRADDGSIALRWIRRTRLGGDSWEGLDVPLGEESERYEVEVRDGGNLVRVIGTDVPTATYALVDQQADFGGPAPASVEFAIAQLNAFARGPAAIAVLS